MPKTNNPLSPELVEPLIGWYRSVRRNLPWRETKDPYRIWISEIMLQQTRIEAVIPYYHRFLAAVPDPKSLAELPDDRLMKLWEGLGYYSRARNLKAAAREITDRYGASLPADYQALRALKGIGDYTAGAIASIAFGLPEPAVDGNVLRVLMRLCGREDDIALASTKKQVTEWLREIYPTGDAAGDMTEGLMELGEQLCIPAGAPKCAECPFRDRCVARRDDRWQELPKKSPKKEKKTEQYTVLLLCREGRIALRKRPNSGLLAGLWEFPTLKGHLDEAELGEQLQRQGITPLSVTPSQTATHIFTHITWHMIGYTVACDAAPTDLTWVTPEELHQSYALPTAFRAYQKLI